MCLPECNSLQERAGKPLSHGSSPRADTQDRCICLVQCVLARMAAFGKLFDGLQQELGCLEPAFIDRSLVQLEQLAGKGNVFLIAGAHVVHRHAPEARASLWGRVNCSGGRRHIAHESADRRSRRKAKESWRGLAPVCPDTAYSQYSGGCSVSA